jgi:protein involved in polysaccharide export with SLBB domain
MKTFLQKVYRGPWSTSVFRELRQWLTTTMWAVAIAAAAFLLLVVTGCQNPGPRFDPYAKFTMPAVTLEAITQTNQINPEWLKPPADMFTLGPGDRLEIEVLDDPTSKTLTSVGPDGKIYFHLLPGVDVWGLTLSEAKAALEKELAKFIRDRSQVGLTLKGVESKHVWLLGRLQAPGVYPMAAPMTLLEAISRAGGTLSITGTRDLAQGYSTEEVADLKRSFVIRKGQLLPIDFQRLLKEGDLSQNIYLQPDDLVYLPAASAREIYVLGAVVQPRTVPYTENISLISAIANAQGIIRDAFHWNVAIVRGSLNQPRVALVDYKAIAKGEAPDVRLEPQDIVYVPFKPYRVLTRYGDIAMQTFVSSVAINEGARAAIKAETPPAGVFIPLGSRITIQPNGVAPR